MCYDKHYCYFYTKVNLILVYAPLHRYALAYAHRHAGLSPWQSRLTEASYKWRMGAEALGWCVTESLSAIAEPAGVTPRAVYEGLRDQILHDLKQAEPDLILLQLHGAMVADGYEDTEADLVARCRALFPQAFIGVALDLHCHLNQPLVDAADAIITMKEYPHDDVGQRGQELFDLAVASLESGYPSHHGPGRLPYDLSLPNQDRAHGQLCAAHERCGARAGRAVCVFSPRFSLGGFSGGWRAYAGGDGWRSVAGQ